MSQNVEGRPLEGHSQQSQTEEQGRSFQRNGEAFQSLQQRHARADWGDKGNVGNDGMGFNGGRPYNRWHHRNQRDRDGRDHGRQQQRDSQRGRDIQEGGRDPQQNRDPQQRDSQRGRDSQEGGRDPQQNRDSQQRDSQRGRDSQEGGRDPQQNRDPQRQGSQRSGHRERDRPRENSSGGGQQQQGTNTGGGQQGTNTGGGQQPQQQQGSYRKKKNNRGKQRSGDTNQNPQMPPSLASFPELSRESVQSTKKGQSGQSAGQSRQLVLTVPRNGGKPMLPAEGPSKPPPPPPPPQAASAWAKPLQQTVMENEAKQVLGTIGTTRPVGGALQREDHSKSWDGLEAEVDERFVQSMPGSAQHASSAAEEGQKGPKGPAAEPQQGAESAPETSQQGGPPGVGDLAGLNGQQGGLHGRHSRQASQSSTSQSGVQNLDGQKAPQSAANQQGYHLGPSRRDQPLSVGAPEFHYRPGSWSQQGNAQGMYRQQTAHSQQGSHGLEERWAEGMHPRGTPGIDSQQSHQLQQDSRWFNGQQGSQAGHGHQLGSAGRPDPSHGWPQQWPATGDGSFHQHGEADLHIGGGVGHAQRQASTQSLLPQDSRVYSLGPRPGTATQADPLMPYQRNLLHPLLAQPELQSLQGMQELAIDPHSNRKNRNAGDSFKLPEDSRRGPWPSQGVYQDTLQSHLRGQMNNINRHMHSQGSATFQEFQGQDHTGQAHGMQAFSNPNLGPSQRLGHGAGGQYKEYYPPGNTSLGHQFTQFPGQLVPDLRQNTMHGQSYDRALQNHIAHRPIPPPPSPQDMHQGHAPNRAQQPRYGRLHPDVEPPGQTQQPRHHQAQESFHPKPPIIRPSEQQGPSTAVEPEHAAEPDESPFQRSGPVDFWSGSLQAAVDSSGTSTPLSPDEDSAGHQPPQSYRAEPNVSHFPQQKPEPQAEAEPQDAAPWQQEPILQPRQDKKPPKSRPQPPTRPSPKWDEPSQPHSQEESDKHSHPEQASLLESEADYEVLNVVGINADTPAGTGSTQAEQQSHVDSSQGGANVPPKRVKPAYQPCQQPSSSPASPQAGPSYEPDDNSGGKTVQSTGLPPYRSPDAPRPDGRGQQESQIQAPHREQDKRRQTSAKLQGPVKLSADLSSPVAPPRPSWAQVAQKPSQPSLNLPKQKPVPPQQAPADVNSEMSEWVDVGVFPDVLPPRQPPKPIAKQQSDPAEEAEDTNSGVGKNNEGSGSFAFLLPTASQGLEPNGSASQDLLPDPGEVGSSWEEQDETAVEEVRVDLDEGQKAELRDLLQNYSSLFTRPRIRLQPRGLINGGNICFMNSILQALIGSETFCQFLKHLETVRPALLCSKEPGLYCLASLAGEFEVIDLATPETDGKAAEVSLGGKPLSPEMMSRFLSRFNPRSVPVVKQGRAKAQRPMAKREQEDAQEFLGFLLDTLQEELVTLKTTLKESLQLQDVVVQAPESDGEGWVKQKKGNKKALTQETGVKSSGTFIQSLVGGQYVTQVRAKGAPQSETGQAFTVVNLDVLPSDIDSISSAIDKHTAETPIEGYKLESGGTTTAKMRMRFSTFPKLLILVLSRFTFDADVLSTKVHKTVKFDSKLKIKPNWLTPESRKMNVAYDLVSVVTHLGTTVNSGHYIAHALQQPSGKWIKFDDQNVTSVPLNKVLEEPAYLLFYQMCHPNSRVE